MASRQKPLNHSAKSPQPRGRHHKNVRPMHPRRDIKSTRGSVNRPNRILATVFAITAVAQTIIPIILQRMTHAIIIRDLLSGGVSLCLLCAFVVGIVQFRQRCFGKSALIAYYLGLAILIYFDAWIKWEMDASV